MSLGPWRKDLLVWMTEEKKKCVIDLSLCFPPFLLSSSKLKNKSNKTQSRPKHLFKGIRRGEKKRPNRGITLETSGMRRPAKKWGVVGAISGTCVCKQDDTSSRNPEGGPYSEKLLRVLSVKVLSPNLKRY